MNAPHALNEPAHSRQDFYDRIRGLNLTPLWESLHSLVPREPKSPATATLWRYRDVQPYLMQSGELITAEEAVRRVLVLENPGLPGRHRSLNRSTPDCNSSFPVKWRPHTDTYSRPCDSLWTARVHTPRSTASERSCIRATSSSRRPGPGTITATKALTAYRNRSCGLMASISPCCVSSMPVSRKTTPSYRSA